MKGTPGKEWPGKAELNAGFPVYLISERL